MRNFQTESRIWCFVNIECDCIFDLQVVKMLILLFKANRLQIIIKKCIPDQSKYTCYWNTRPLDLYILQSYRYSASFFVYTSCTKLSLLYLFLPLNFLDYFKRAIYTDQVMLSFVVCIGLWKKCPYKEKKSKVKKLMIYILMKIYFK